MKMPNSEEKAEFYGIFGCYFIKIGTKTVPNPEVKYRQMQK